MNREVMTQGVLVHVTQSGWAAFLNFFTLKRLLHKMHGDAWELYLSDSGCFSAFAIGHFFYSSSLAFVDHSQVVLDLAEELPFLVIRTLFVIILAKSRSC